MYNNFLTGCNNTVNNTINNDLTIDNDANIDINVNNTYPIFKILTCF